VKDDRRDRDRRERRDSDGSPDGQGMAGAAATNIGRLVGGSNIFYFFPFHIWDVILPIDELIFFKMVKTTNQTI